MHYRCGLFSPVVHVVRFMTSTDGVIIVLLVWSIFSDLHVTQFVTLSTGGLMHMPPV